MSLQRLAFDASGSSFEYDGASGYGGYLFQQQPVIANFLGIVNCLETRNGGCSMINNRTILKLSINLFLFLAVFLIVGQANLIGAYQKPNCLDPRTEVPTIACKKDIIDPPVATRRRVPPAVADRFAVLKTEVYFYDLRQGKESKLAFKDEKVNLKNGKIEIDRTSFDGDKLFRLEVKSNKNGYLDLMTLNDDKRKYVSFAKNVPISKFNVINIPNSSMSDYMHYFDENCQKIELITTQDGKLWFMPNRDNKVNYNTQKATQQYVGNKPINPEIEFLEKMIIIYSQKQNSLMSSMYATAAAKGQYKLEDDFYDFRKLQASVTTLHSSDTKSVKLDELITASTGQQDEVLVQEIGYIKDDSHSARGLVPINKQVDQFNLEVGKKQPDGKFKLVEHTAEKFIDGDVVKLSVDIPYLFGQSQGKNKAFMYVINITERLNALDANKKNARVIYSGEIRSGESANVLGPGFKFDNNKGKELLLFVVSPTNISELEQAFQSKVDLFDLQKKNGKLETLSPNNQDDDKRTVAISASSKDLLPMILPSAVNVLLAYYTPSDKRCNQGGQYQTKMDSSLSKIANGVVVYEAILDHK
jgi:hypothetical protein